MTDNKSLPEQQSCSINSRRVGEALIGTAPKTENWLLLEIDEPPGVNALLDSSLKQSIKDHLLALQSAIPSPRLLLIRARYPTPNSIHTFYLAAAGEQNPRLYEFHLGDYEDLLGLNITAILGGDPVYAANLRKEPVFVVCTNGKRDPCCARWGLETYNALADQGDITLWQTSHVGGHRFAANLVLLPYGIYYGHVGINDAACIITDSLGLRITLENYRGRACYPPIVQIADYYLRVKTQNLALDGFRFTSALESSPDHWQICFTSTAEGQVHTIDLIGEMSGTSIFESCSTPEDLKPVKRFKPA